MFFTFPQQAHDWPQHKNFSTVKPHNADIDLFYAFIHISFIVILYTFLQIPDSFLCKQQK